MAMDGNALGDRIAEILTDAKAPADVKAQIKQIWQKIGTEIVTEVKKADITVPAGTVVVSVVGQATGMPNLTPISNTVA